MNDGAAGAVLDEFDAKQLLAAWGVPVVGEARASDRVQAVAVAERLGYPVALKACGAAFAHKTEFGLVRLNLGDAAAVDAAAGTLLAAMGGQGDLLVQRMVSGTRELLIGMSRDPQFGPVVTFGLGGIFAEALGDVSLRVCPLTLFDARAMQDEIRAHVLLGPLRGLPRVDRDVLARALLGVSRLALARPDIAAIDINPLVVAGSQPVAVDALVLLQ
jgi:succinyl-CoA synthetase beta subunit